jgi:hypothetical protein
LKTEQNRDKSTNIFDILNEIFDKPVLFFHNFYTILHFDEFCRTQCFKFLNLVLAKNLEIESSFLDFLFQIFLIF